MLTISQYVEISHKCMNTRSMLKIDGSNIFVMMYLYSGFEGQFKLEL
jgi:hypothetical protein